MTKVERTMKEILEGMKNRHGLRRRRWLTKRKGIIFTLSVELGDKLNNVGNKEN